LHQIERTQPFLTLRLLESPRNRPASGKISIQELAHPVPKQALRAALEAQHYSQANDMPRAIAKLEEAIRIDPAYRDAHTNLGAQFARSGRYEEALDHFRRALEIGPPDTIIYTNMSWVCSVQGQFREAERLARMALALDSTNDKAQRLLDFASQH